MNLKSYGLAAFVSGAMLCGNAYSQNPETKTYSIPQNFQQTIIIQVQPPIQQNVQDSVPYRIDHDLDNKMQSEVEKLTLDIKYFEPGIYKTIVERNNRHVRGINKLFRMDPAEDGFPKVQTNCWKVLRQGSYDLFVRGNDWDLELGVLHLLPGDKIIFHKISHLDYTPSIAR